MAKAIIQDVVPPRRSVRDIIVPDGALSGRGKSATAEEASPDIRGGGFGRNTRPQFVRKSSGKRPISKGMWVIATCALLFLYLAFAVFFAGANVTVTPRQEPILINDSFTAKQTPGAGELPFEVMTVTLEKNSPVPATGEKYLEQKASGIITIFNDFDNQPLRLVKNTRFESASGLMYRIANPVIIPPQTTENGVKKPGQIDAEVYADTPGAEYNIETGMFTVPGLKDSPQFSSFYAKTKTPIAGGYDGMIKVVDPASETAARQTLRTGLAAEAEAKANAELPLGYTFWNAFAYTVFEPLVNTPINEQSVAVAEKVVYRVIMFNQNELARFIASKTIPTYNGTDPVSVADMHSLQFAIVDKETVKPWEEGVLRFTVAGNSSIIWHIEEGRLKGDLTARPKKEMGTVLANYPGIAKATVTLRPFWKKKFPKSTSRITITNTLQEGGEGKNNAIETAKTSAGAGTTEKPMQPEGTPPSTASPVPKQDPASPQSGTNE